MDVILALLLIGIPLVCYFLPTLIGNSRKVANPGWLFLFNLFGAWTIIGWLVALIWAVAGASKAQDRYFTLMAARATEPGHVP